MVVRAERVLFITTSVGEVGDSRKRTGLWLGSLAEPYYLFQKKGYITEVASMRGGTAPIDPLSMEKPYNRHPMTKRFLADGEALGLLDNTSSVAYISADRYSAIFITGKVLHVHDACCTCYGLGIAVDAPYSKELQRLLSEAFAAKKVVAAVGRGVAALLSAKITDPTHPQAGMPIVYGKQVTGYSNVEEELSGHASEVPFSVEDRIEKVGGEYTRGNRNEGSYANKAGLIITGQNSASALSVAELVVEALSYGVRLTP
ncbi:g12259 [Coccomyxa viridis]|uniref:G12259 protein n=1 Tax=Coccomyxa viridis TaxID=1274662 RepID=A0ABP1GCI4_9CHLO